jgi:hypothetical protein
MQLNKLAIFIVVLCFGLALCKSTCEKTTSIPKPLKTGDYDFIVVGGGTGGAITAARLSENFDVLLLESGPKFYDNNTQSSLVSLLALPRTSLILKSSRSGWPICSGVKILSPRSVASN